MKADITHIIFYWKLVIQIQVTPLEIGHTNSRKAACIFMEKDNQKREREGGRKKRRKSRNRGQARVLHCAAGLF